MDVQQLKNLILSLTQDIEFTYNEVDGSIIPIGRDDVSVSYGDQNKDYHDVDILLKDPIFDGKSLVDIAEQIEILN